MERNNTLISRDAKDRIRVIELSLTKIDDAYCISRKTGIFNMKMVEQPDHIITKGKSKRTLTEQADLEYNAILRKQKDKGYKDIIDFGYTDINDFNPEDVLPENNKTDQNGCEKPQLCKKYKDVKPEKFEEVYMASRKLDGVRCSLFFKDGEVKTSSRGGKNYDTPAYYICNNIFVVNFFKKHPDIKLDGELYRHGWGLSKISGMCRLKEKNDEMKKLQFHCYDIIDTKKTFKERMEILKEVNDAFRWVSVIQMVEHIEICGYDNIINLHNQFVSEGYEGLVLRDPNGLYKSNAKDDRMIKVKMFEDDEFEIIGMVEGLREEDFSFVLITKEGCEFKAKPSGDRELKKWYRENIDKLIGKMGTVKYFNYTDTECRVPYLPVFKCIRDEIDM